MAKSKSAKKQAVDAPVTTFTGAKDALDPTLASLFATSVRCPYAPE